MMGDGEVGLDFDAAGTIGFGVEALGDFSGEGSGSDSTGPEDGASGQGIVVIAVFEGDAFGTDAGDQVIKPA